MKPCTNTKVIKKHFKIKKKIFNFLHTTEDTVKSFQCFQSIIKGTMLQQPRSFSRCVDQAGVLLPLWTYLGFKSSSEHFITITFPTKKNHLTDSDIKICFLQFRFDSKSFAAVKHKVWLLLHQL